VSGDQGFTQSLDIVAAHGVTAAGDGIGAEQHARQVSPHQTLHDDGHLQVCLKAPRLGIGPHPFRVPRAAHHADGLSNCLIVAHIEHRLELAGERRSRRVLGQG
jgi:hypothetical protein